MEQKKVWTAEMLADVLGGTWLVAPTADWHCEHFAINREGCAYPDTMFIAIDTETWLKGSGNTGIYAGWDDTHLKVKNFHQAICGVIVQKKIEDLPETVPQLLVENTYQTIRMLCDHVREKMTGKVIAITGTVGKSTTKEMLAKILSASGTVIATHGNHNTRTGVPLTLARCISDPDYVVLETAMSALWMRSGGISRVSKPDVVIITEIGLGQVRKGMETLRDTAHVKAKIADGIKEGGIAVLNRDMAEYDYVKSEVEGYGASVLSYGFGADADMRCTGYRLKNNLTEVCITYKGQEYQYTLPLLGRSSISNSMGALLAAVSAGAELENLFAPFAELQRNEGVLEPVAVELKEAGVVHLLDDSHNAEILSMIASFDTFRDFAAQYPVGKKICVLGRVVNLGEQASPLHKQLKQPLLDLNPDMVFLYGEEMQYLAEELPKELLAGYYADISLCARAVASVLQAEDCILLKGSRRANDFAAFRKHLAEAIETGKYLDDRKPLFSDRFPCDYGVMVTDLTTGKTLWTEGNPYAKTDRGLGSMLLLTLLLRGISQKKYELTDHVTIGENPAKEQKNKLALQLAEGDKVSLYTLLQGIVCAHAPDALLAAADVLGGPKEAKKQMQALAKKLGISEDALRNLTGRKMEKQLQSFNLYELGSLGKELFGINKKLLHVLRTEGVEHKGRLLRMESNLLSLEHILGAYLFGKNEGEGVVLMEENGRQYMIAVCGARDFFHRDQLILKAMQQVRGKDAVSIEKERFLLDAGKEDACIQFIGDTYFGEYYTKIRQKNKKEDALSKYGYGYSFEGLKDLFAEGDANIVNLEATLTDETESPIRMYKPFILSGDKEQTIRTLQDLRIHGVTLGNNHAMDFGRKGLEDMLQALEEAGMPYTGAGRDSGHSIEPLRIRAGEKEIVIFSGYWYRSSAYFDYDFYAMPGRAGVACLKGELREQIQKEKRENPKAYIIVMPHFGVDFTEVSDLQRRETDKLLQAGADLIIGHGAHMMQQIEQKNGRWVLYGIGNGVFNSNGEYDKRGVPPYGFFVRMLLQRGVPETLRIYPIYLNNLQTFWQPCVVTEEQFKEVVEEQARLGSPMEDFAIGADRHGMYFDIPLKEQ
ncbi:MAG: CapA family protein [Anaerotignum sp.]|nr:CapA family protein [Anaerotignum sp.]